MKTSYGTVFEKQTRMLKWYFSGRCHLEQGLSSWIKSIGWFFLTLPSIPPRR